MLGRVLVLSVVGWVLAAGTAIAADYVAIELSGTTIILADPARVDTGSTGYRRGWFVFYSRSPTPEHGERVYFSQLLEEFDCTQRRMRPLQSASYGQTGNTLQTYTATGSWTYAAPNTAGEAMMVFVCASETRRAEIARSNSLSNVDVVDLGQRLARTWPDFDPRGAVDQFPPVR